MAHYASRLHSVVPFSTRFAVSSFSPASTDDVRRRNPLAVNFCQGHGGAEAAEYVASHLSRTIHKNTARYPQKSYKQVVEKSFEEVQTGMKREWATNWQLNSSSPRSFAGTSVSRVEFTKDNELLVSHLGGTAVYLVKREQNKRPQIMRLTKEHTLTNETERQNILRKSNISLTNKKVAGPFQKERELHATFDSYEHLSEINNHADLSWLAKPSTPLSRTLGDFWNTRKDTGQRALLDKPVFNCVPIKGNRDSQYLLFLSRNLCMYFDERELLDIVSTTRDMANLPANLVQHAENLAAAHKRPLLWDVGSLLVPLGEQAFETDNPLKCARVGNRGMKMVFTSPSEYERCTSMSLRKTERCGEKKVELCQNIPKIQCLHKRIYKPRKMRLNGQQDILATSSATKLTKKVSIAVKSLEKMPCHTYVPAAENGLARNAIAAQDIICATNISSALENPAGTIVKFSGSTSSNAAQLVSSWKKTRSPGKILHSKKYCRSKYNGPKTTQSSSRFGLTASLAWSSSASVAVNGLQNPTVKMPFNAFPKPASLPDNNKESERKQGRTFLDAGLLQLFSNMQIQSAQPTVSRSTGTNPFYLTQSVLSNQTMQQVAGADLNSENILGRRRLCASRQLPKKLTPKNSI